METKDTSTQSQEDGGGAAREAAGRNKAGCSALWAQPCQLPPRFLPRAEDPTAPATPAGAGPGPGDKPKPLGSHLASSPCTVQHFA